MLDLGTVNSLKLTDLGSGKNLRYLNHGSISETSLDVSLRYKINSSVREALFGIDSVMFPNGCKVKVKDCENIEPAVFHHNDFLEIVQNTGTKQYIVKRWNVPEENNPHIIYQLRLMVALKIH